MDYLQRSFFYLTLPYLIFSYPRDTGTYSSVVTMPDTITDWEGQAVCVHPEKGIGLSNFTSINTFIPFFLDLTLPPSIKRGETLGVLISVFNYLRDPLPVST